MNNRTSEMFIYPDAWKMLCYPRFFDTKLHEKHGELENKKMRFGMSYRWNNFWQIKKKHDEQKLYTILTEFIPFFDEKMETINYEFPEKFHSEYWGM